MKSRVEARLLTHRQTQIAQLLVDGTPRVEIASALNIKPATVKKYLQRARRRAAKKVTPIRLKRTRIRPFSLLSTDNI